MLLLGTGRAVQAQNVVVTTIHSFTSTEAAEAHAGLIIGPDGNFYGTSGNGGPAGLGTVYKITPAGVVTVLYDFNNTDGSNLLDPLVLGSDGNFYGTTHAGGTGTYGTMFKITSAGTLTVLHNFGTGNDNSQNPYGLVQGGDGDFYGTTNAGGANGFGTVFQATPAGVVTILHSFDSGDGENPQAGLILAGNGNFYGTTSGGVNGDGTVFTITSAGTLTTLYSFGYSDGSAPEAALVQGSDGNFYGTTNSGGASGDGTVFQITPAGVLTSLHSFAAGAEGEFPSSALVQAQDGSFYGVTINGGANSDGTIYAITPTGTLTTLYTFAGTDGQYPTCTLVRGGDGFYGTTAEGGANGFGSVFRLSIPGNLALGASSYTVNENMGSASLTVRRTGGFTGVVSVNYAASDDTATAGTDYTAASGTVSWADGDTADKTITVPLLDPHVYDGSTRTFLVTLSAPTGGVTLQRPGTAQVNITEDDILPTQPTISLDSPPDGATVFTGSALTLAASVDDPSGALVSVQFTIDGAAAGSAGAAGPYVATVAAPATDGAYTVAATATDTLGRTSTSTHTLNVRTQQAAGDPAPQAAILTDLNAREVGAGQTIPLVIVASTSDGDPLQELDIYADGEVVARFDGSGNPIVIAGVGRPPVRADAPVPLPGNVLFQTNYQVPGAGKIVNLLAVAFAASGVAQTSPAVSIQTVDPSVDRPPVIALLDLSDGTTVLVGVPTSVPVSVSDPDAATASTAGLARQDTGIGTIADLAFYLNAALVQHGLGNDPAAPSFTFTPPAAGDYVLNAIATDGAGLSGLARPVTIHAVNPPPPLPMVNVAVSGDGQAEFGLENAKVIFQRTGDAGAALVVSYKLKGTAVAGVDFKALPGTVTIPAGESQVKVKFKPLYNPANAGKLKAKILLLPSTDGSYQMGSATLAKVNVVGGG